MVDVFIGYRNEDHKKAKSIAETVAHRGYSVWWEMPSGLSAEDIGEVVRKSKVAIILWSKPSVQSPLILHEARQARELGTLVTARLERVLPPGEFQAVATVDLTTWHGDSGSDHLDELMAIVEWIAGPARHPEPASEAAVDVIVNAFHFETICWTTIAQSPVQRIQEYRDYLETFGSDALFAKHAHSRIANMKAEQPGKAVRALALCVAGLLAAVAAIATIHPGIHILGFEIGHPPDTEGQPLSGLPAEPADDAPGPQPAPAPETPAALPGPKNSGGKEESPARTQAEAEDIRKSIVRLQQALTKKGFYNAGLDGIAGPETVQAIAEFHSATQLDPLDVTVATASEIVSFANAVAYSYPVKFAKEPEGLFRTPRTGEHVCDDSFTVYFGRISTELNDMAMEVLLQAFSRLQARGCAVREVSIVGFDDTSQTDWRASETSRKRAEVLRSEFVRLGVSEFKVYLGWQGKNRLAKFTKDGVPEPLNRRATARITADQG